MRVVQRIADNTQKVESGLNPGNATEKLASCEAREEDEDNRHSREHARHQRRDPQVLEFFPKVHRSTPRSSPTENPTQNV